MKFLDYSRKAAAVWDDLVEFLFAADERYRTLGAAPANFLDLGLCDDPEFYDGTFEHAGSWAERRWMTPGAVLNGRLQTTNVADIDAGIEEFIDNAFYDDWTERPDAAARPIRWATQLSARHPWNKQTLPKPGSGDGHVVDVAALARQRDGDGRRGTAVHHGAGQQAAASRIPGADGVGASASASRRRRCRRARSSGACRRSGARSSATARVRTRSHSPRSSRTRTCSSASTSRASAGRRRASSRTTRSLRDHVIGVGYGGGPRGYVSHHVEVDSKVIRNYQIVSPSSFIVSARWPTGDSHRIASRSLATAGHDRHIDMLRTRSQLRPLHVVLVTLTGTAAGR